MVFLVLWYLVKILFRKELFVVVYGICMVFFLRDLRLGVFFDLIFFGVWIFKSCVFCFGLESLVKVLRVDIELKFCGVVDVWNVIKGIVIVVRLVSVVMGLEFMKLVVVLKLMMLGILKEKELVVEVVDVVVLLFFFINLL